MPNLGLTSTIDRQRVEGAKVVKIVSMSGVGLDGKPYLLSYPWICTDAGRSQSKRPRQSNDCTVRALALALDCPYDQAYDTLKTAGRIASRGCQPLHSSYVSMIEDRLLSQS